MHVSKSLKPFHKKIAQVCAYIASKMPGETLPKLKLYKLLYLVDRMALEMLNRPVTYDDYKVYKKGPVPADTFSSISKKVQTLPWSALIRENPHGLLEVKTKDFGCLSNSELQCIDTVLLKHGRANAEDLVAFVHTLPEWKSNKGGRLSFREILLGINSKRSAAELEQIEAEIEERRQMELLLVE